jgi:uncharacterized membrane protein YozB (DUF420 family)
MEFYFLVATATLVVQIAVFVLLIVGYQFKRQLQYRKHGAAMASAVIAHAISIFIVMIPSFSSIIAPTAALPEPQQFIYTAGIVHGVTGALAFLIGAWLVIAWRFGSNVQGCIKRKKIMRVTLGLWLIALVLGIMLFALFYWQML